MDRIREVFTCEDPVLFRQQLLQWISAFDVYAVLDSCGNDVYGPPAFDMLCGAGMASAISLDAGDAFQALESFAATGDWLFGHLNYDLKNETESLSSSHPDSIGFPDLFFFRPTILIRLQGHEISIESLTASPKQIMDTIVCLEPLSSYQPGAMQMHPVMPRSAYLNKVEAIRRHIINGDVYELNFCQEFLGKNARLEPVKVFDALCAADKAPMSVLHRNGDRYLISASPERFLMKQGNRLLSMPIKGTIRRGAGADDEELKEQLRQSIKDRAENVMITDLVRNDLTRFAKTGSIRVDELFGVYPFARVFQMISTISAELQDDAVPVKTIRQAFPMGSMTGAPKVKAMELIDRYEVSRRGLYSGAFGYFTPDADFDFNVVIRSVLYNQRSGVVSVQAGGAIVYDSDPVQEYEECLLKASSLFDVLRAELIQQ